MEAEFCIAGGRDFLVGLNLRSLKDFFHQPLKWIDMDTKKKDWQPFGV